ncbi:MAG TPA: PDZ domain-containing protein [Burkholderiales bacterium]
MRNLLLAACLLAVACASERDPQPVGAAEESMLPGTIGVVVRGEPAGLVVVAVREGTRAVREGDIVLRYNATPVASVREFNRLVADSRPGSIAELELRRAGVTHRVRLPVRQLDTTPRG